PVRTPISTNQSDYDRLEGALVQSVRDHWVLFLVEGLILVVLGLAAIVIPALATLAVAIFVGWLFLIAGIVGLITTFMMRQAPGFWWSLLSALVSIAAGIVLVGWPVSGGVSLTLVLIVFCIRAVAATIMSALAHS